MDINKENISMIDMWNKMKSVCRPIVDSKLKAVKRTQKKTMDDRRNTRTHG